MMHACAFRRPLAVASIRQKTPVGGVVASDATTASHVAGASFTVTCPACETAVPVDLGALGAAAVAEAKQKAAGKTREAPAPRMTPSRKQKVVVAIIQARAVAAATTAVVVPVQPQRVRSVSDSRRSGGFASIAPNKRDRIIENHEKILKLRDDYAKRVADKKASKKAVVSAAVPSPESSRTFYTAPTMVDRSVDTAAAAETTEIAETAETAETADALLEGVDTASFEAELTALGVDI